MAKQSVKRRKSNLTSITTWRKFAVHRIIYLGLAFVFGLSMIAYFSTGNPGSGRGAMNERAAQAVVTVNGEPVARADYERLWEQRRREAGGSEVGTVMTQGSLLSELVDSALLRSIAKKRHLSVSDADVDQMIESMRQQFGKKDHPASEDELVEMLNVPSINVLRDQIRQDLLPRKLQESFVNSQKVTEEDLRKSYDEVKARHILIATTGGPNPLPGALPDAQAKRKAEEILKEIKAGKDFATLANQNTMDTGNKMDSMTGKPVPPKGGDLGWAPYDRYVPEFAAAARALKPGEVSGLVKTPFGYHIIKVEGTRSNLPKDYAKQKSDLIQQKKAERAQKPFMDLVEKERKAAKIVWNDPSLKWKYDFSKIGGGMMMLGNTASGDREAFVAEMRKYVKENPDDSAAALILGQQLYNKYLMMMLPPPGQQARPSTAASPERDKLRKEIIANYASALKRAEDLPTRFSLAQLYEEDKQPDKALEQYQTAARILSWDDTPQNKFRHEQLAQAFTKLGKPDLAAKERQKVTELTAQEKKEAAEKAAEEAKVKAAEKAAREKAAQEKAAQEKTAQEPGKTSPPANQPTSEGGPAKNKE